MEKGRMKNGDPVTILFVEDDEIDAAAIRRALRALERFGDSAATRGSSQFFSHVGQ
jgi:hypothetical protein